MADKKAEEPLSLEGLLRRYIEFLKKCQTTDVVVFRPATVAHQLEKLIKQANPGCIYMVAWSDNQCGAKTTANGFCDEHLGRLCGMCSTAQAVTECSRYAGSGVCGLQLCRECEKIHGHGG